ncbi:hypothetical protein ACTMU2_41180 [Cupriavidus basilensis]
MSRRRAIPGSAWHGDRVDSAQAAGVPEDAGAAADLAPVTTAEREVPAEPLPVQGCHGRCR